MVKLYTTTLSQLRQVHEARFTCCKTSLWGKKLTVKKIILHFNVSVCFSNCTNILFFNTKCMNSTSCGYCSLCSMLISPSHICTQNLIYHSKMGSEDKIPKLLTFKVPSLYCTYIAIPCHNFKLIKQRKIHGFHGLVCANYGRLCYKGVYSQ
jgi:hypothetical protein